MPGTLGLVPPLSPGVYLRAPRSPLPFPLEDPRCRLFGSDACALRDGLRRLGLARRHAVLVPAALSPVALAVLAESGVEARPYATGASLEPTEAVLEQLLTPDVRAVWLTHGLGLPADALAWRRWCDARGLLLIEDARYAWFASSSGRPVGSFGDIALLSPTVTLGLPHAALVVSRSSTPAQEGDDRVGVTALARSHAAWLAQRSSALGALGATLMRNDTPPLGWSQSAAGGPSHSAEALLARLADDKVAASRRANYALLAEQLGDAVPDAYTSVPSASAPFAIPVETRDAPALLERLARQGVLAERLPDNGRHSSLVALPVHQGLRGPDLERIAVAMGVRRASRAPLHVEQHDDLDALREDWTRLAKGAGNVFSTWEWASTWWRRFGAGRRPIVVAIRRGSGSLAGIVALYVAATRPVRIARLIGSGSADQLAPICAPEDRTAVAHALRSSFDRGELDVDLILAEGLPSDEGWQALLGGRVLRQEPAPFITIDRSWEEFVAGRTGNLRQKIRRTERVLRRDHAIDFRLVEDASELPAALDTLFRLHEARWGRRGIGAFSGTVGEFHRDFAARALERGWLRLWLLEVEGESVAAWLGYRFADTESYYQSGRDPAWDRYSVGFMLLTHTIRCAFEDGVREYRFLRGDEPYKARFASEDHGLQAIATGRGRSGRAFAAAADGLARHARTRAFLRRLAD